MSTTRSDPGVIALAIFFALAPGFAVGGALGFAVLLTLAGLACLRPSQARDLVEKRPVFIGLLLVFVGWMGLSTLWSPYPAHTQALQIGIVALVGLPFVAVAASAGRRIARAGAVATIAVLLVLLAIEAATPLIFNSAAQPGVPLDELNRNLSRGASFMVVMTWGAIGALALMPGWLWRVAALALGIGAAALSTQFGQAANAVAFVAGLGAFAVGLVAPRFATWATTGGLALWLLGAPVLTPLILSDAAFVDALPTSWAMRDGIWDFAIARIWEQPLFGHGMEASRTVTERIVVHGVNDPAIPNHPHSFSLQIWFELGVVGALIGAAMLLVGGRWLAHVYGERRIAAASASATLAAAGVIANVSFSAWAEWWVATFFIAAATIGAIGADEAPSPRARG
jgi:O-antigen ligase